MNWKVQVAFTNSPKCAMTQFDQDMSLLPPTQGELQYCYSSQVAHVLRGSFYAQFAWHIAWIQQQLSLMSGFYLYPRPFKPPKLRDYKDQVIVRYVAIMCQGLKRLTDQAVLRGESGELCELSHQVCDAVESIMNCTKRTQDAVHLHFGLDCAALSIGCALGVPDHLEWIGSEEVAMMLRRIGMTRPANPSDRQGHLALAREILVATVLPTTRVKRLHFFGRLARFCSRILDRQ